MLLNDITRVGYWLRCSALGMPLLLCVVNQGRADEISDAYSRLQANPASVTLNLDYAAAAEKGAS